MLDPGGPARPGSRRCRDLVGAGEPLNPEVIEQRARGLGPHHPRRLRPDRDDGAGRQHAGPAGEARRRWAGRCPAIAWRCSTPAGSECDEGELCLALARAAARPDARLPATMPSAPTPPCAAATTAPATWRGGTATAIITYVGRADDVFKASDYRISPFELESVLIEHAAVAEAAVVPSPDPVRAGGAEGVHRARRRCARRRARPRGRHLRPCARAPGALQARPPPRVRGPAEDDLRQDPPRRAAPHGGGSARPPAATTRPGGTKGSSGRRTSPGRSEGRMPPRS